MHLILELERFSFNALKVNYTYVPFSPTVSQAERNYVVDDRELLAIKLAQEEWQHWLEGSEYPVIV